MVRENKRKEGKFDLAEKAKEFAIHTLHLTSNEKNFPKKYRFTVVNKLQEKSIYIMDCIVTAQELYPNTKIEYEKRVLYQKEARAACRSLMTLMEISADSFGISTKSFEYWSSLASDLYIRINGWIKKDNERFKDL